MDQGTVKHFDPDSRSGSLLTDDRREIAIDAGSLEGSGILTLRFGQRVRFATEERDGATVARSLRIVTAE